MSLTGNLEDLPLLDIIQIVSFSKKTGYLTIRNTAGEGAIVFSDGTIVASFTWDSPPLDPRAHGLPEGKRYSLIRNRIEAALEQLIRLREGVFSFSLTERTPTELSGRDIKDESLPHGINAQEILIDLARGLDEDRRDSAAALEAPFDGGGEPSLAEEPVPPPEEPARQRADDTKPLPPLGAGPPSAAFDLPPEAGFVDEDEESIEEAAEEPGELALEDDIEGLVAADTPPAGVRLEQPDALSLPEAPPSAHVPGAAAAAGAKTVLLVDDEADVRQILADHLTRGGYTVVEAEDPDSALKQAALLGRARTPFLVVTDLGMPTSGGSSFQGGFEVVKRLWKMNLNPPVLMMTDGFGGSLQARARQMNIASLVFKPGLSKLDPEQFESDMRGLAGKILGVLPRLANDPRAGSRPVEAAPTPVREKRPQPPPVTPRADAWDAFAVLQQRLEELRKPSDASQVSLLVMKVAREFFERGLLFLVKGEELRGLGGFGRGPAEQSVHTVARDIVIPLTEPSVFQDVVADGRPFYGALPAGRASRQVAAKVGQFQATSVAILPLLANREVIALLYGDNPDSGRQFGRLEPLELFVTQAGVALENAFLQRKLQAMRDAG